MLFFFFFCQLELFLFKDDLSPNKYAILSTIKNKNKHQRMYILLPKEKQMSYPVLEIHTYFLPFL